jgi:hypothetical protein
VPREEVQRGQRDALRLLHVERPAAPALPHGPLADRPLATEHVPRPRAAAICLWGRTRQKKQRRLGQIPSRELSLDSAYRLETYILQSDQFSKGCVVLDLNECQGSADFAARAGLKEQTRRVRRSRWHARYGSRRVAIDACGAEPEVSFVCI